MTHGPTPQQSMLATGGLVAALLFASFVGAAAMRARGERSAVTRWLLWVWLHGAAAWAMIAGALLLWDGDFWVALDAVKAGQASSLGFTAGLVCAVGALVALLRLSRLARGALGEPPLRAGDGWPAVDRPTPAEHGQAEDEKEERN